MAAKILIPVIKDSYNSYCDNIQVSFENDLADETIAITIHSSGSEDRKLVIYRDDLELVLRSFFPRSVSNS